jgi:adenylate cyclase
VIPRAFQFRRFSHRLLFLVVGLLFAALATTYLLVSRDNFESAQERARVNLQQVSRIVDSAVRQRIGNLAVNARVVNGDYAFKQAFSDGDPRTISSALVSFANRTNAEVITFYDPEGKFIASSDPGMDVDTTGPFRFLISEAIKQDLTQHSGFSYLKGKLHALVVIPFYAPEPNIFGWFGLAFPLDRAFVWGIRDVTGVELTYICLDPIEQPRVLATTLSPAAVPPAIHAAVGSRRDWLAHRQHPLTEILDLPDDRYVSLIKFNEMLAEEPMALVLQRPLSPELESARNLENFLKLTSLIALAAATLLALGISRSVSEPVVALVGHTQRIARGDYSVRNITYRADELGRLSEAFDHMARGLAERDRVRDLLDKNVSPEVAAQLLRDGAALGGEEREVTILFADIRGFTMLSEKLPPQHLVKLLNRYFNRMSAAIEAQGGIIDKFIGDAIMALFGAPVSQSDAADRALAAGLAMERALAELNRELAAEGIAPIEIGIGVNSARVVAGNIGSQRRLNYSVIGDGVNVASRLQSLTRVPQYGATLITSAATLAAVRAPDKFTTRPLGPVIVKGRAEAVEIFAVS